MTMTMNGTMNLAEVKDYYPLDPGTEMAGGLKANINVAGKVSKPDAMQASGTMEFNNVTVKTASTKNPVQNLNGSIAFNNQVLESKKLAMMIGKSDLALSFTMKNYLSMMSTNKNAPKPVANATLTSNHIYTADITGDEKSGGKPAGQPSGKTEPQPKKAAMPLPNVEMNIAATIGTLTMERFELKNVKGTMKILNGIITMPGLTFNTFDGSFTSKGTINMQKPERPLFDMTLDANGVQANGMLSKFTSFGQRLFGNLSMSTTLKGALDDTLGLVPSSLVGRGDVKVQEGRLQGVKVNQQLASMLKAPDLENINFKDWANGFTITDGRVQIPELKINALGADYTVKGSQGLDGSMDFGLSMLLSQATSAKVSVPGFAGEAVSALKEPDGRMKLDFLVGGTMDGPKVSLDTKALQSRVADFATKKLDAEKQKLQQKLGDEAKKKGDDLLKGLFNKKK
jgi:hypothetical protein